MKYTKEEADRLLTLVEQHLKSAPEFTATDMAALHEMVQAWRGWVSLGRGAKWVITVLGLIAAAVASWSVLANEIKKWLQS